MSGELVSQAEFARRMQVSKSQVTRAIQSGRIAFYSGTRQLDFVVASKLWEENRSDYLAGTGRANNRKVPNIGRIPKLRQVPEVENLNNFHNNDNEEESNDETLNTQKIRKTKAEAERVELKLAQERGDLIAKQDVLSVFFTFLVALKNSVLATPDRVVGDIYAAIEQCGDNFPLLKARVYDILRSEHNRTLDDIEGMLKKAATEVDKIADKYR